MPRRLCSVSAWRNCRPPKAEAAQAEDGHGATRSCRKLKQCLRPRARRHRSIRSPINPAGQRVASLLRFGAILRDARRCRRRGGCRGGAGDVLGGRRRRRAITVGTRAVAARGQRHGRQQQRGGEQPGWKGTHAVVSGGERRPHRRKADAHRFEHPGGQFGRKAFRRRLRFAGLCLLPSNLPGNTGWLIRAGQPARQPHRELRSRLV